MKAGAADKLVSCRNDASRVDVAAAAKVPPMRVLFSESTVSGHRFPASDRPERRVLPVCRDPLAAVRPDPVETHLDAVHPSVLREEAAAAPSDTVDGARDRSDR
jgi:hypothetical protein